MSTPILTISFEQLPLNPSLVADLRSDHAGETGAVTIYRGILRFSRDHEVRAFAREHLLTELRHRHFFDLWLPARHQSRLLPVWRAAGWSLGAVAALVGKRCVFRTIAAVETFVEKHYQEQIQIMSGIPELQPLVEVIEDFCAEEVGHRDDAAARLTQTRGWVARGWEKLIGGGSAVGVTIARVI